jgi:hypothetical protein
MPPHHFFKGVFKFMERTHGTGLVSAALAIYILGGAGTFAGLFLIVFMSGGNLGGWGEARSIGYLLFCVGLCCSIVGVLLMRLFRNRMRR